MKVVVWLFGASSRHLRGARSFTQPQHEGIPEKSLCSRVPIIHRLSRVCLSLSPLAQPVLSRLSALLQFLPCHHPYSLSSSCFFSLCIAWGTQRRVRERELFKCGILDDGYQRALLFCFFLTLFFCYLFADLSLSLHHPIQLLSLFTCSRARCHLASLLLFELVFFCIYIYIFFSAFFSAVYIPTYQLNTY